jgi:hypothetical protein
LSARPPSIESSSTTSSRFKFELQIPGFAIRRSSATSGTTTAQSGLGQTLLAQTQKRTLTRGQISFASTTLEIAIEDQRLPAEDVGKEFGRSGSSFCRARLAGRSGLILRSATRSFGRFVSPEFRLDVDIPVYVTPTSRPPSSPAHASMAPSNARRGLFTNALANPFGLLDQVVEEVTDIIRHTVDHREDLFENVPDEIRGRDSKIGCKISDVLGKLFGDPGMENPLLSRTMTVAAASRGMT